MCQLLIYNGSQIFAKFRLVATKITLTKAFTCIQGFFKLIVLKILTETTLKRRKEYVVCQKEKKNNNWKRKAMILLKYLMLYHGTKRKLSARNRLFAC
jgi:hypothetical protein